MIVKLLVFCTILLGVLVMFNLISLDTFMDFWQWAFVVAVKAAIFAAIPGGFLLAIYLGFQG